LISIQRAVGLQNWQALGEIAQFTACIVGKKCKSGSRIVIAASGSGAIRTPRVGRKELADKWLGMIVCASWGTPPFRGTTVATMPRVRLAMSEMKRKACELLSSPILPVSRAVLG